MYKEEYREMVGVCREYTGSHKTDVEHMFNLYMRAKSWR